MLNRTNQNRVSNRPMRNGRWPSAQKKTSISSQNGVVRRLLLFIFIFFFVFFLLFFRFLSEPTRRQGSGFQLIVSFFFKFYFILFLTNENREANKKKYEATLFHSSSRNCKNRSTRAKKKEKKEKGQRHQHRPS